MGRGAVFMLNGTLISVIVGAALGILAGLGVGGGSLLMLWRTIVHQTAHTEARTVNLLFFLPCALSATLFRWRQGVISPKDLIPAMAAGCVFAGIGTWLSGQIHLELLKKLFGCLLIFTGFRELFYRDRNAR